MKIKRRLSFIMALAIILTSLPIGEFVTWAEEINKKPEIKKVTLSRIEERSGMKRYNLVVDGENLSTNRVPNFKVYGTRPGGDPVEIVHSDIPEPSETKVYYPIREGDLQGTISVGKYSISFSKYKIPQVDIAKSTPTNGILIDGKGSSDMTVEIKGQNLPSEDDQNKADQNNRFIQGMDTVALKGGDPNTADFTNKSGSWELLYEQTGKAENSDLIISIESRYPNFIRIQKEIKLSDVVEVIPNRGPLGTEVDIKSKNLNDKSVFFVKKIGDKITSKHMGEEVRYVSGTGTEPIDTLTVKVPESLKEVYPGQSEYIGDYYIIITNKINPGQNPDTDITAMKILDKKFTVIDSESNMTLMSISPRAGSTAGGYTATIKGLRLLAMGSGEHQKSSKPEDLTISKSEDESQLILTFKNGNYTPIGGEDGKKKQYESLTRTVKVYLGDRANFDNYKKDKDYEDIIINQGEEYDSFTITVPQLNTKEEEDNLIRDLKVEIDTKIKYKDVDEEVTFTEVAVLEKAFQYIGMSRTPIVSRVVPEKIPVIQESNVKPESYKLNPENIQIVIHGENFSMYRIDDGDKTFYKYPVISFYGKPGFKLDPDKKTEMAEALYINNNFIKKPDGTIETIEKEHDVDIKIYDKDGKILDGRVGNDNGTKIVITMNKEEWFRIKGKDNIDKYQTLKVLNPVLNNEETVDLGTMIESKPKEDMSDQYMFVTPEGAKPLISKVEPSLITTEGRNDIKITGTNFDKDIKLFLDGEEIKIKENLDGKFLTFDAPPKDKGIYKIMVQNRDGQIAVSEIEYTILDTNIKLTDFEPKKGSKGTIVTVTGSGFLMPSDRNVTNIIGSEAYKLVGTRVMLGGVDVNEYNYDPNDKKQLKLENFKGKDLFKVSDDGFDVADYYRSIVLVGKDNEGKDLYYTVFRDSKTSDYIISDGHLNKFIIRQEKGKILAYKDGVPYEYSLDSGKLTLSKVGESEKIEMDMKTFFKQDNSGNIIGHKAKVMNSGEIILTVPEKFQRGYYDLRVENYDTNYDERTGENGFFYVIETLAKPTITKIDPNRGPDKGGYYITISGSGFQDEGSEGKAKVIIGSQEVDPKDIEILAGGTQIKVRVPKYPGDLSQDSDIGEKTVPVTVLNPDGQSISIEDGFTYLLSRSDPVIYNLIKNYGSTAGKETVLIEGREFLYYEPIINTEINFESLTEEELEKLKPKIDFEDLNGSGKWDDIRDKGHDMDKWTEEEVKLWTPVLPKIYFGAKEAKIIRYEEGMIEVETPSNSEGIEQVYLINNDNGISNLVPYDYRSSDPTIVRVDPKEGPRSGDKPAEIEGSNFYESQMRIIDGNSAPPKLINMMRVRYGNMDDLNISNKFADENDDERYGLIKGSRTVSTQVGDLKVSYNPRDVKNKILTFEATKGTGSNKETFTFEYSGYDDREIFFPISKLDGYGGYELVRVYIDKVESANKANRLVVERGFSPEVNSDREGFLDLRIPSYYTIGDVDVTVINSDGAEATASKVFKYRNPDSKPEITDILKDGNPGDDDKINNEDAKVIYLNIKGGNLMEVKGKDFRKPVKITIGDTNITEGIEYDPNDTPSSVKASFIMPEVPESYVNGKPYVVYLTNEDGGVTNSKEDANPPIYIKFFKGESAPEISSLSKTTGPSSGGTKVTIKGKDFRDKMENYTEPLKVFVEDGNNAKEVKQENIVRQDIETIIVTMPPNETKMNRIDPVNAKIKVVNPDGSMAISGEDFIYTGPTITNMIKDSGSALGEDTVFIEGNLFKFYDPFKDKNENGLVDEGKNEEGKEHEEITKGWKDIHNKSMRDLTQEEKKILPKIYFGEGDDRKEGVIIGYEGADPRTSVEKPGVIQVKIPKGIAGSTPVYIRNNDGEESVRVPFEYTSTQPVITAILPNESTTEGNIKVTILGEEFHDDELRIYKNTKYPKELTRQPRLHFGNIEDPNISNINNLDLNDPNSGRIIDNNAKVSLGNLTLEYGKNKDGKNVLRPVVTKDKIPYGKDMEFEFEDENGILREEIFLPLSLLKNKDGQNYRGKELVRVVREKVPGTNNIYRIRVERGYAERPRIEDKGTKIVIDNIPGYYEGAGVKVTLTNPDGVVVQGDFTYILAISSPKIENVVNPENNERLDSLSVLGGERIKLIGENFATNEEGEDSQVRVLFNPKIRKAEVNEAGNIIYINGVRYILESGVDGTDVKVIDGKNLLVTTPAGEMGDNGILVINPDTGASNIYNIAYGIPQIGAPFDVKAELVLDQFIRVSWSGVSQAKEYEIHASTGAGFEFVGTTEGLSYAFGNLQANTRYKFMVKAIGEYGTSKPIDQSISNEVRTGSVAGPEDTQGELSSETEINKNGEMANVILGTKDYTDAGLKIDLTTGKLAGAKNVSIKMPASIISSNKGEILIIGKDYRMKFKPGVFNSQEIMANKNNRQAGVVFNISLHEGNPSIRPGELAVGGLYNLTGLRYVGASNTNIDKLSGNIELNFIENVKISQAQKVKVVQKRRYDNNSKQWIEKNNVDRLGRYGLIGSRR